MNLPDIDDNQSEAFGNVNVSDLLTLQHVFLVGEVSTSSLKSFSFIHCYNKVLIASKLQKNLNLSSINNKKIKLIIDPYRRA